MQCGKAVYVERQLLRAAPRAVHFAALFTAFRCVAPVSARTLRRRGLAETDSSACGGGREGHVRMERERHGRAAGALLFCPTGDGVCVGVCVGGGGGANQHPKQRLVGQLKSTWSGACRVQSVCWRPRQRTGQTVYAGGNPPFMRALLQEERGDR